MRCANGGAVSSHDNGDGGYHASNTFSILDITSWLLRHWTRLRCSPHTTVSVVWKDAARISIPRSQREAPCIIILWDYISEIMRVAAAALSWSMHEICCDISTAEAIALGHKSISEINIVNTKSTTYHEHWREWIAAEWSVAVVASSICFILRWEWTFAKLGCQYKGPKGQAVFIA